jgi:hypothetical protein
VLVVGRHRHGEDLGVTVGAEPDGGEVARPIEHRDVLRGVDRDPREHPAGLRDGLTDLEHVAHHQGDAEAVADRRTPAEGERGRQPGVVDPVEQPPQAVAHPDHPAPLPLGAEDHTLEPGRRVVVVAHEQRAAARPHRLRAAGEVRGGIPHREHAGRQVAAAGQLDQPVVRAEQLRHVLAELAPAHGVAGEVRLAGMQKPFAIRRPALLEQALPAEAGKRLVDGLEGERNLRDLVVQRSFHSQHLE